MPWNAMKCNIMCNVYAPKTKNQHKERAQFERQYVAGTTTKKKINK